MEKFICVARIADGVFMHSTDQASSYVYRMLAAGSDEAEGENFGVPESFIVTELQPVPLGSEDSDKNSDKKDKKDKKDRKLVAVPIVKGSHLKGRLRDAVIQLLMEIVVNYCMSGAVDRSDSFAALTAISGYWCSQAVKSGKKRGKAVQEDGQNGGDDQKQEGSNSGEETRGKGKGKSNKKENRKDETQKKDENQNDGNDKEGSAIIRWDVYDVLRKVDPVAYLFGIMDSQLPSVRGAIAISNAVPPVVELVGNLIGCDDDDARSFLNDTVRIKSYYNLEDIDIAVIRAEIKDDKTYTFGIPVPGTALYTFRKRDTVEVFRCLNTLWLDGLREYYGADQMENFFKVLEGKDDNKNDKDKNKKRKKRDAGKKMKFNAVVGVADRLLFRVAVPSRYADFVLAVLRSVLTGEDIELEGHHGLRFNHSCGIGGHTSRGIGNVSAVEFYRIGNGIPRKYEPDDRRIQAVQEVVDEFAKHVSEVLDAYYALSRGEPVGSIVK